MDWCDHSSAMAKPMDASKLHGRALSVKGVYPRKNWAQRFIKHHPTLVFGKPSRLNPNCANNFNKPTMKHYFQLQKDLEDKYGGIPPEHQWNMDEKGIQLGGGHKNNGQKFIFARHHKNCYHIWSDNLELVTIIECISTSGAIMPPAFILKDGSKPDLCDLPDGSVSRHIQFFSCMKCISYLSFSIAFSLNGWTDREICETWFSDQFVKFTKSHCIDPNKPIVLNYDGHDSHETVGMQRVAFDMGVILFAFPSKTMHKTQPLDVCVFSLVQDAWSLHCNRCIAEGITMDRYNVIHEYLRVRHGMMPELVRTAFRKTSIYPLNPGVFTAINYAPSKSFSIVSHVPSSFPTKIPSSPPAHSSDLDPETSDFEYRTSSSSKSESSSDSELSDSNRKHRKLWKLSLGAHRSHMTPS